MLVGNPKNSISTYVFHPTNVKFKAQLNLKSYMKNFLFAFENIESGIVKVRRKPLVEFEKCKKGNQKEQVTRYMIYSFRICSI